MINDVIVTAIFEIYANPVVQADGVASDDVVGTMTVYANIVIHDGVTRNGVIVTVICKEYTLIVGVPDVVTRDVVAIAIPEGYARIKFRVDDGVIRDVVAIRITEVYTIIIGRDDVVRDSIIATKTNAYGTSIRAEGIASDNVVGTLKVYAHIIVV